MAATNDEIMQKLTEMSLRLEETNALFHTLKNAQDILEMTQNPDLVGEDNARPATRQEKIRRFG